MFRCPTVSAFLWICVEVTRRYRENLDRIAGMAMDAVPDFLAPP
jgi:hypothetical protein